MAQMSIEDFMSDGYTFPGTGGSLVITIESNGDIVHYFEISGNSRSNIISFTVIEDDEEAEVIETEPGTDYAVELKAEGEYVEITIEVGESPSLVDDNYSFETFFDYVSDRQNIVIGQNGYTPPAPVWEDAQHKIYRSGHQVMKMYRSGELIYLRLNPPSEEPVPPTPEPTYQWVEVTADFDRSVPFTKVRWDFSKSWSDGFFSELPNINCDNKGWSSITGAEWGYAGQYTMNLSAKKCYIRNQSTGSYALYDMYSIATQVDTNLYEYEYSVPLYWGGVSNSSLYNNGLGLYVYVEVNPTNE